jgi:peptidyl-prolyl cis-trans isomerase B (cyclophilin B)
MKNVLSIHKTFPLILAAILSIIIITGCGTQSENGQTGEQAADLTNENNPIVTITMENGDKIMIELYPEIAPNTVANFISLIEKDFYNGVVFHRVIPEFMIQGGDPNGNGTGGPDYAIQGEFESNGFENNLKHDRGILSMARTKDPDSAGSQFFIMLEESSHLDGEYAAFGKVIEGMETVDAIAAAERDSADKPLEDQRMKTVEVDTKGQDYPEPEVEK